MEEKLYIKSRGRNYVRCEKWLCVCVCVCVCECVYNRRVTMNYHKRMTYVCAIDFKYFYPI